MLGLVGIAGGVCVMVMVAIMSRCCCKQRTPAKTSPSGKSPKRTPIKGRRVKYTRQARTEESADKAVAKGRRESPEEEESEEVSEEESEEEGQTVPARHTGTNEQQEDKCEEETQTVPQKANVSPGPVNGQSNGEPENGVGEEAELLARVNALIPPEERKRAQSQSSRTAAVESGDASRCPDRR